MGVTLVASDVKALASQIITKLGSYQTTLRKLVLYSQILGQEVHQLFLDSPLETRHLCFC